VHSLKTSSGENHSERVQSRRAQRGFSVHVGELNKALFSVTIEGASGKIEVQVRLSAFGVPQTEVDAFGKKMERAAEGNIFN
jgi:hypothetical protein